MILQAENVIKRYQNQLALDYFSMSINEGEVIGLLGPNGAGKTTFIKTLIGLLSIDEGEINVFGIKQDGKNKDIRRQIGYVTQEITIYEEMTAKENLAFFGSLYGLKKEKLDRRILEVAEIIGLKDKLNQKAGHFSGGMKRRLNIGCALLHEPKLLILDEPTVGIDPQSRNYILEFVRKAHETGMTILYTSHYIEEVEAVASRVLIMDQGHPIAEGTLRELIERIKGDSHLLIDVRIGSEEVREKLQALPDVKEVALNDNQYHVIVPGGVIVIDRIIPILSSQGIVNINSKQPNLEDVFLTLTGKQLRDEV
ncbi:ABC transporter ATP-binding protein [Proteiniclasticum sp.]|uniref:ABC transporter ATP-binding protein n=1 Tax=Proteiniclasticum sp. TaxID=2053595 RepID=UPI002898CBD7|nr:ABC transporter ATP-binding protein [Proteiniclasticum sp.]